MDRLKFSLIEAKAAGMGMMQSATGRREDDDPELQRKVERIEILRNRLKVFRDATAKHATSLQQDSQSHRALGKALDNTATAFDSLSPERIAMQRICEFNTLVAGGEAKVAEVVQVKMSDSCAAFMRDDLVEAKKQMDLYDKAKLDLRSAIDKQSVAESTYKKAAAKDKAYYQDKLKESNEQLESCRDRFADIASETDLKLKIVSDKASAISLEWMILYMEAYLDHFQTCHTWMYGLMTSEKITKWREHVDSTNESILTQSSLVGGPSKKIFGKTLDDLADLEGITHRNPRVPDVLKRIIEHLETSHLDLEGIFRVSGRKNDLDDLRRRLDRGEEVEYSTISDPHVISGILKLYLRELSEPLLTFRLYDEFIMCNSLDKSVRTEKIRQVILKLPGVNRITFEAIAMLCHKIHKNQGVNKMNSSNLGIVFAPGCLYPKVEDAGALEKSLEANALISYIFEFADQIFGNTGSPANSAGLRSAQTRGNTTGLQAGGSWTEHTTTDGHKYWYNAKTKLSTWENPNVSPAGSGSTAPTPARPVARGGAQNANSFSHSPNKRTTMAVPPRKRQPEKRQGQFGGSAIRSGPGPSNSANQLRPTPPAKHGAQGGGGGPRSQGGAPPLPALPDAKTRPRGYTTGL